MINEEKRDVTVLTAGGVTNWIIPAKGTQCFLYTYSDVTKNVLRALAKRYWEVEVMTDDDEGVMMALIDSNYVRLCIRPTDCELIPEYRSRRLFKRG